MSIFLDDEDYGQFVYMLATIVEELKIECPCKARGTPRGLGME